MPPHRLKLKVGVPIKLLQNLDAPHLSSGTRFRVTNSDVINQIIIPIFFETALHIGILKTCIPYHHYVKMTTKKASKESATRNKTSV